MKLKIFLHNFLIFTLFTVVINFMSCKSSRDISDEFSNYIFENKTDNIAYFIKFDSIDGSYAEGRAYFIDNNLTMESEHFRISLYKKKCIITTLNSNTYEYKIKRINRETYEGYYIERNTKSRKYFSLYPYQKDDCQSFNLNRYRKSMFDVERIPNVRYAHVEGFWSSIPDDTIDIGSVVKTGLFNSLKKRDLELDMDIYIPKNDTLSKRPLLMLIHGGAFFIGDKATVPYQRWCRHFASLGYVCVSINYRMGFRINSKAIERTAYQATQDAHAAMRYLVSKKDIYRIDTDYLFVGGASAGSITAMNLTYMRNKNRPESSFSSLFMDDLGPLETSGNKLYNKFKIKAVANMWGTMYDLDILRNSNASIISFHGDEDVILPYGFGYPFRAIGEFKKVFFDEMYGSSYIHERAQELGIRSELHTFHGQGHSLHLDENRNLNENFYTIQNEITDFFYEELISHPALIVQDKKDVQLFTVDTTNVVEMNWEIIGGISIEESNGKIRASWFDDELKHEIRVSGYYKNGAGFEDVLVLKNIKGTSINSPFE